MTDHANESCGAMPADTTRKARRRGKCYGLWTKSSGCKE